MSFVNVVPDAVGTAATQLATLGNAINQARSAAAPATTTLTAAAEDEVSTAVAALFSDHAQQFQALGAQAASLHDRFVQAMTGGAESYALTEAASTNPLQQLFAVINAPTEVLLGRPLIGNGANAAPGSGQKGGDGGLLLGNGGAGGLGGEIGRASCRERV